jgi:hypothetical protein
MDVPDERDVLLARRIKLGVRLVLYPLLLGLLAVALHARLAAADADDGGPPAPVAWHGAGADAWAQTVGGRLTAFTATVVERCADGARFRMRWSADGRLLTQTGSAASARQTTAHGIADDGGAMTYGMDLDATIGEDVIRATLAGTVLWRRAADGRLVRCDAGPVRRTLVKSRRARG